MNPRYILLLVLLSICACVGNKESDKSPNDTTLAWLDFYDNADVASLKKISTGKTLEMVNELDGFLTASPEEDKIVVRKIQCSENPDKTTSCVYCCNDEEEETFILTHENGRWKVTEIIVSLEELDEEAVKQEKLLEQMLNKQLNQ